MKREDKIRLVQEWVKNLDQLNDTLLDVIFEILSSNRRPDGS